MFLIFLAALQPGKQSRKQSNKFEKPSSFIWRGFESTGYLFQALKAKLSTSRLREIQAHS